jgi:Zn-dependent peptidase ImmA (M78 family)/DNA-binding XRE family transcriptional regulator
MNGERLRQARELCGLTQQGLADLAEVAQSTIAQIEAGLFQPTETVAKLLSAHTGFDLKFLNDPNLPQEFPAGSLLYRGKVKASPKDKAKAHKLAQLVFEMILSLKTRFRPIPVTLPRFGEESPTEAARLTRSHLGLSPDTPIKNITSVLERAGVLIIRVPLELDGLDGFSAWVGRDKGIPIICLIGAGVGYRDRYTNSEEAGHLIMHAPLRGTVADAEGEVKTFVGEFVLPEEAMRREMIAPVTLTSLATLRHRWGASIQFLAARSHQLGITTANQYKYLMQQVSNKGWRTAKREPGDELIPQETPQLLLRMLESAYGTPLDLRKVRRDSGIPVWLLREIAQSHGIATVTQSSVVQMKSPLAS